MNIILVNCGQAETNSAYHIYGFARELATRGHDVVVAVIKSVPDGEYHTRQGYRLASHRTVLRNGGPFPGKPTDVLHVWTPREISRQFAENYRKVHTTRALFIHLEDHEEAIFERFTGSSVKDAAGIAREWPKGLIHPDHYRDFLKSANGVTMVHRCLDFLVPQKVPRLELCPVMDPVFFTAGEGDPELRQSLGIAPGSAIIVYNGNDHPAVQRDIVSLYMAVDMLIQRGRDVVFVRTGNVLPDYHEGLGFRPGTRCIELGFVKREMIPGLMRLATLAIQPGDADDFNAYRLPAKLPEYLTLGKPIITGKGNIGPELEAENCAVVLPRMTSQAMADAAEKILDHPAEAAAMGAHGRAFALKRFSADVVVSGLEAFYTSNPGPK